MLPGFDSPTYQVQAINLGSLTGGGGNSAKLPKNIGDPAIWAYFRRWAYAAANATAQGVMMADLYAQEFDTETGKWIRNDAHPLSQLLTFVNPFMTAAEFKYWAVADLEMTGTSYWKVIYNAINEPAQLWPLIGKMTPNVDKTDGMQLESWTHDMGKGEKETLQPEEVLFLRYPDPRNFWAGYGPAMAAAAELRLDDAAVDSQWAKYKQGVFPTALLFMETPDEEKRQQFVNKMESKFAGIDGMGRVIGLAKTMDVKFPPTAPIIGDVKGSENTRDTILGIMRVPKEILGLGVDANRASIWGMKQIFADYKLKPTGTLIEERLNQDLASMYGDSEGHDAEVQVQFASFDPTDPEEERAQEEHDLKNNIKSVNEIRDGRGLEPVEWGDVPIVTAGTVGFGEEDQGSSETQSIADQITMADARMHQLGAYTSTERNKIAEKSEQDQEPVREAYSDGFKKLFQAIEKMLLAALDQDQENAERLSIDDLQRFLDTPNIDKVIDIPRLREQVLKAKSKIDREGVVLGGEFEQSIIDPDGSLGTVWSPTSASARTAAAQYGAMYNEEIANETSKMIKDTIQQAVEDQATWAELRLAIVETMGEMQTYRADRIATTETTRVWNAGGQAFRDENAIEKKQWIASFVRTRPTHAAADGDIVDNNGWFSVGADRMKFPGEGSDPAENVNCRCTAVGFIPTD
jgi:phage portal protein BeeE